MGISVENNENEWNTSFAAGRSVIYDLVYTASSGTDTADRLRAVVALGKSDDPRAVRPLMDLLGDSDPGIRLSATTALGLLKSGRPVDDLIEKLRDRNEQMIIREQAAVALSGIRSTGALRGLREFSADKDEDAGLRASTDSLLKSIGTW
jgi:hypothetical protein